MAIREFTVAGRFGGDPSRPEYWEHMTDIRLAIMPDDARLVDIILEARRRGIAIFCADEHIQQAVDRL